MSSSRVQTILTGPSTLLPMRTAVAIMSTSSLRPNPPPSRCWWIVTLSSESPAAFAATDCARNDLRSDPDITGILRDMDSTIQRFHRRVGQQRHFVGCVIALAKIEQLGDIPDRF